MRKKWQRVQYACRFGKVCEEDCRADKFMNMVMRIMDDDGIYKSQSSSSSAWFRVHDDVLTSFLYGTLGPTRVVASMDDLSWPHFLGVLFDFAKTYTTTPHCVCVTKGFFRGLQIRFEKKIGTLYFLIVFCHAFRRLFYLSQFPLLYLSVLKICLATAILLGVSVFSALLKPSITQFCNGLKSGLAQLLLRIKYGFSIFAGGFEKDDDRNKCAKLTVRVSLKNYNNQ